MPKTNVRGVRRLCRKPKILCKSHYLGRAIHKLCRENGEDAILMTPKVIMATQRQLWAHLSCRECEGRLNKFGETPVLKLLDTRSGFRLLELMHLALELKIEPNTVSFSGSAMGVNSDALAHFALGILWKGSVNKWRTVEGQTTSITLGPFEEPIRKYLLGESGFPPDVYVLVGACEDLGSRGMVFAPSLVKGRAIGCFPSSFEGYGFTSSQIRMPCRVSRNSVAYNPRGGSCTWKIVPSAFSEPAA